MVRSDSCGNKTNRERFEEFFKDMPDSWTPFPELVKSSKLDRNRLCSYLTEAKRNNLAENMRKPSRFHGRIFYWRKV